MRKKFIKDVFILFLATILFIIIYYVFQISFFQNTDSKKIVLLVVDKYLLEDEELRLKISRYKEDNRNYEFKEIVFEKTGDPVTNLADTGRDVKHNSLQLRNTIKKLFSIDGKRIVGVWLIGNIRPKIFRDVSLWRALPGSGFYPSIYPLVALDDEYYTNFDVENDGFYEKEGATTGSEFGGAYNATIWGAVLIPPTTDNQTGKELIKKYFDRDHNYRTGSLKYEKKLLYSDGWGCSNELINKIKNNHKGLVTFLCPNYSEDLKGFDSLYKIIIHSYGSGYDPSKTGWGGIKAKTKEEKEEYNLWLKRNLFDNSTLISNGDSFDYYLILNLKGRSVSSEEIKNKIKGNLPPIICKRFANCAVYVKEYGFAEQGEHYPWDALWTTYPLQQNSWKIRYDSLLKQNNYQITYLKTHGDVTFHYFGIDSDTVKNGKYSSMIYEIEACNVGNYSVDGYLAGSYLFYGNALSVSAYSIPFLIQTQEAGYYEEDVFTRFLKIKERIPIVENLFVKNYSNSLYFGDPLLLL